MNDNKQLNTFPNLHKIALKVSKSLCLFDIIPMLIMNLSKGQFHNIAMVNADRQYV